MANASLRYYAEGGDYGSRRLKSTTPLPLEDNDAAALLGGLLLLLLLASVVHSHYTIRKRASQRYPFYARVVTKAGLSLKQYLRRAGLKRAATSSEFDTNSRVQLSQQPLSPFLEHDMLLYSFIMSILQRLVWTGSGEPVRLDQALNDEKLIDENARESLTDTLAETLVRNERWCFGKWSRNRLRYWCVGRLLPRDLLCDPTFEIAICEELLKLLKSQRFNGGIGDAVESASPSSISPNDFEIWKEELGKGSFGVVFKGCWKSSREAIAIKKLTRLNEDDSDMIRKEVNIQRGLCHPNVLHFYGYCRDKKTGTHYLLTQYMAKGSLRKVLTEENLPWFTKERLALEIAEGLKYLHDNNVAHRDLKSLNVLLDSEYHGSLCDFGISTTRNDSSSGSTIGYAGGSLPWMAPEAFHSGKRKGADLKKIDIYALGVILWEICTESMPSIKSINHSPDKFPDDGFPRHFVKLAQDCFQEDPRRRPSAKQVVERLRQAPADIVNDVFPEGLFTSHVEQGTINNCRYVACLHSLKKNPLAPVIIGGLLTERSRIGPDQKVTRGGWRVYFPYNNKAVNVNDSDLRHKIVEDRELELLYAGQPGDKILLLAASRWRKKHGVSESIDRKADTFVQGEHSRDAVELFRLCLYDRIVQVFHLEANDTCKGVGVSARDTVLNLLKLFADEPDLFVLIAGTRQDPSSIPEYLISSHAYSVLVSDSAERTVTVADPHETESKELVLSYETFVQEFHRVAGVRLNNPSAITLNDDDRTEAVTFTGPLEGLGLEDSTSDGITVQCPNGTRKLQSVRAERPCYLQRILWPVRLSYSSWHDGMKSTKLRCIPHSDNIDKDVRGDSVESVTRILGSLLNGSETKKLMREGYRIGLVLHVSESPMSKVLEDSRRALLQSEHHRHARDQVRINPIYSNDSQQASTTLS